MPDLLTQLADIITPEIYNTYMRTKTAEKSAFVQSGIAVADERVSRNITAGGLLVNMPYWNDLSGADEVLDDGDTGLTTGKITAGADIACVMYRGKGWQVNELSAVVSGDDPMGALMNRLTDFRLRKEQQVLISVMNGLFGTADNEGPLAEKHLNDISTATDAAAKINGSAILDTKQLLGDAYTRVNTLVMHSAVYTALQKQQLIEYIPEANNTNIQIPTYLGYRVIIDDGVPFSGTGADTVYDTYLFGTGSIGRNSGEPSSLTTFEKARDAAKGNDYIYTRWAITMHPYGVKWTNASVSGITPSNEDLANPLNWEMVYEDHKNIALLCLRHKI